MRMEWVASSLALYVGTRSIQLQSADPHSSTASSRLNWHPSRFKWTRPFRWKTKSGFCACAITFRTCFTWTRVDVCPPCSKRMSLQKRIRLEHNDEYGIVFTGHQADSMASRGHLTPNRTVQFLTLWWKEDESYIVLDSSVLLGAT